MFHFDVKANNPFNDSGQPSPVNQKRRNDVQTVADDVKQYKSLLEIEEAIQKRIKIPEGIDTKDFQFCMKMWIFCTRGKKGHFGKFYARTWCLC